MDGKAAVALVAVFVLLAAPLLPVAGMPRHRHTGELAATSQAEPATETAGMVDVPVRVFTPAGVKTTSRSVSADVADRLISHFGKAKNALRTLHTPTASAGARSKAHDVVDTFLQALKDHELLGGLTVEAAKKLLAGGYPGQRDGMDRRLASLGGLLGAGERHHNAMCFYAAWGGVVGVFPYNYPVLALRTMLLDRLSGTLWNVVYYVSLAVLVIMDLNPCPTTVGRWTIRPWGVLRSGGIHVRGMRGEHTIRLQQAEAVEATTLGFTGINLMYRFTIGFCPYIAYRVVPFSAG